MISAARPLYRCYLSCEDAFPSFDMKAEWLDDVWSDACERIGVEPSSMALPHAKEASFFFVECRFVSRELSVRS